MRRFEVINPATGARGPSYESYTDAQVERVLEGAQRAFESWRQESFEARRGRMREVARLLRARAGELAVLMAKEVGKPVKAGRAEVEKCAWVCEYYADRAEELLAPRQVVTDARLSMVRYEPLGVILAVMPWNFPFWQVFRFAAPYLMAGDVGLLKPAPNAPGCGLAVEALLREAGFEEGVFQVLFVEEARVEGLIRDRRVAGVTLTGSVRAGRAVGRVAGEALKPCVLELGGSDPFVVLEDADVEAAARVAVQARLVNGGQSCIAAKRFIVHEAAHDAFVEAFARGLDAVRVGDPLDEATEMGPMARADLRDELHKIVEETIAAGAVCMRGGQVPDGPGAYYPPTLLVGVEAHHPAAQQETFGPVAAVIRVRDEAEAVAVANGTAFGLGASVWTRDMARGLALAPRIEAGHVAINAMVKSDPRLPFGGVRDSGFGRELGEEGIKAFVNAKVVWVG